MIGAARCGAIAAHQPAAETGPGVAQGIRRDPGGKPFEQVGAAPGRQVTQQLGEVGRDSAVAPRAS